MARPPSSSHGAAKARAASVATARWKPVAAANKRGDERQWHRLGKDRQAAAEAATSAAGSAVATKVEAVARAVATAVGAAAARAGSGNISRSYNGSESPRQQRTRRRAAVAFAGEGAAGNGGGNNIGGSGGGSRTKFEIFGFSTILLSLFLVYCNKLPFLASKPVSDPKRVSVRGQTSSIISLLIQRVLLSIDRVMILKYHH